MEALRLFKGVKKVSLEENLDYPKLDKSIEELNTGKTERINNMDDLMRELNSQPEAMFEIEYTNSFKKDYKRILKRGYNASLLFGIIEQLMNNGNVELKYKQHKMSGKYSGYWECHIQSDWLLIWNINEEEKLISLLFTGTYSDLF